jgi:hypothetical protein
VGAFDDAFVFAALIIAFGIVPALLVRNARFPSQARPIGPSE